MASEPRRCGKLLLLGVAIPKGVGWESITWEEGSVSKRQDLTKCLRHEPTKKTRPSGYLIILGHHLAWFFCSEPMFWELAPVVNGLLFSCRNPWLFLLVLVMFMTATVKRSARGVNAFVSGGWVPKSRRGPKRL